MPKFDKKYIHCVWDEVLEGKKVFYADNVKLLKEDVESGTDIKVVSKSRYSDTPFSVTGNSWLFVYYDPYYELKLAYEQGEIIQIQSRVDGTWEDFTEEPYWDEISPQRWRVKPKDESKLCTHGELAQWLSKGSGMVFWLGVCSTVITFDLEEDDKPVPDSVRIRKWGDTEWVKPCREYMGLEEE